MSATMDILFSQNQIQSRIKELAAEISREYAGREVTFLVTLKGAVFFACDLAKYMTIPVFFEFIQAESYSGTSSTGSIKMKVDVPAEKIAGKDVIIIEDVIDTGRTLSHVVKLMESRNPRSLKVCALLDKKECRDVPFEGDYIGFTIGNEFVIGYGLDVDQKFRNFPFIGILRGYSFSDETVLTKIVGEANIYLKNL